MDEPKWKKFEKLVYEIQKELTGDAAVKLNDSIPGVDSKTDRQIDISIRKSVGPYAILIVVDCKDHSVPLDVKEIESFAGMVKDVRANRGALITSTGFTEAALNLARNHGIDTFRLIDTESVDWKSYAEITCLLQRKFLHSYNVGFHSVPMKHWEIPTSFVELNRLEFGAIDGTRQGTIPEIIYGKWNDQAIPREPGTHLVVLGDHLVSRFRGIESHQKITANIVVKAEFFFGPLPVKLRGFQDMQTGGVMTRTFTTDAIEFHKIETGQEKNWKRIDDPDQLAVLKPQITLEYFDAYTDEALGR